MATGEDMLKPAEAALVAHVAVGDVHRVIDEHILPDTLWSATDGRHVLASACGLIAFYFGSAGSLTAEWRRAAIREAAGRLRRAGAAAPDAGDWILRDDFLTIDLAPFIRRADERMAQLAAARALVVRDPEILGGAPVIRGTRVPAYDVAASVAEGVPMAQLLSAYPSLNERQVRLAALYAEANPVRGRPRKAEPPAGAVVTGERRVPRRRAVG